MAGGKPRKLKKTKLTKSLRSDPLAGALATRRYRAPMSFLSLATFSWAESNWPASMLKHYLLLSPSSLLQSVLSRSAGADILLGRDRRSVRLGQCL